MRRTQTHNGVMQFIGIQLLALVVLWFFPEPATWLPKQIYR